jgi:hypothetical protein
MLTESSCSGIRKHLTFLYFTFPSYLCGAFFLWKKSLWQNRLHGQHAPPSVQKWSPDSSDRSTQKRYTLTIVHLISIPDITFINSHQERIRYTNRQKWQTWVQPNKRSSRRRGHESATNPRPWSVTLRHQDMSNTSKLILECLANATSVLSPACTQRLALCPIIPCDTHLPSLTSSIRSSLAANM